MRSRIKQEPTELHDDAGGLLPPTSTPTPMTPRATTPVSIASTTPAPSTADRTSRAAMSQEDTDLPNSSTVTPDNRNGDVDMLNSQVTATPSAMEQIGTPARQLIQAVQRLEALNIDATLESIPKFVVIGDQSAGKSSVIEAICDVQLPRNEGTCTRCPYQISTTSSGPDGSWSCRIAILNKYGYDEHPRAGVNGATFKRWIEKDTDVFEFVTLHDKQELEGALCRAQLAVLNPQQNPLAYLNVPLMPGHAHKQKVGFSPNVISLEITAPNLPDLSFYDLPGAINTISDESQEFLVEFVEKLLKKYMNDEEARIVLACSANQDLEVSTTLRFLRQVKASHRTLGVLTKPDLVEFTQAKVTFFQDLLQGKQYKLGGGWFVSRQLSQTELNGEKAMTHEQAREIEAGFFSTEPWTSSLAAHAHRFGIPHLQQCISRELIDDIIRKLPIIATRVQGRLSTIDEELKTIPEAVAAQTASLTVITEIDNVKTALISEINADSNQSELRKKHRQIFRDLVKRLRNLKPEAVWVSPGYKKPSIAVDDSSEDDSPSKRAKTKQGSRAMSSTPGLSVRSRRTPASPEIPHTQAGQIRSGKTIFRLNEVKARFDSSPGGDIPDQVNDAVVRSLILEPLSIFSNITNGVIKQIRKEFIDMLDRVVMAALSQRLATELYRQVVESAKSLFEELLQEVTDSVCRLVAAACHRPIAYNPWLPPKRSDYEIENLRLRREQRVEEHYAILEAEGQRVPNLPDQNKKAADISWVNSTLGVDDYEREVKALATPLAYYDVASAQLVDNVAQQVECGVMAAYENHLSRRLFKDLRATEPEHCVALLAEDPAREARREQLLAERAKLEKALAELEALPVTHA